MLPKSALKAMENLVKWARSPEWTELQAEAYEAFVEPVEDILGLGDQEILDILDGEDSEMLLVYIFEDFFAARFGDDGEVNVVDAYLKRRGWRESAPGRRYLEALRDSRVSLYEVVDISPGRSVVLEDMLRGGKVTVQSKEGSRGGARWDRLAARIVHMNGENHFTGAVLSFSHELSSRAVAGIDGDVRDRRREIRREMKRKHGKSARLPDVPRALVVDSLPVAQMLGSLWLIQCVMEMMGPLPELRNTDGEDILHGEVRFSLQGDAGEVAARLDGLPELERLDSRAFGDAEEEVEWEWSAPGKAGDGDGGVSDNGAGIGATVLGHVVLRPGLLVLTANSKERCYRGEEMLSGCLGGLVGRPVSAYRDPVKALEERDGTGPPADGSIGIPPEAAAGAIHSYLDGHYRRTLDAPLPALGGRTPREAATGTREERRQAVDWIKQLENWEDHRALEQGTEPYDTGWIWKELKLEPPD